METPRKFTRIIGARCAHLNPLEVWGSEIFKSSTMLCGLSRFENLLLTNILFYREFLVQSIFQIVFLMLRFTQIVLMRGEVYCKVRELLRKELFGGLEMSEN